MREEGSTTYAAYEFNAFSSTTLNNILRQHSKPDFYNLSICILIVLTYTGVVLYRYGNPVNGQSGVGMFGVLLLCLSTASGLGVCSLFGIPFNIVTTQVVPLIALGLAVDQVFILTHGYDSRKNSNEQMHTAQILKKYGMSVLFNGSATTSGFLIAALLPIPVLRSFAIQISILITINLVTVLFVFPAFITLDLRRRRSSHLDILCCLPSFSVQSSEVRNQLREPSTSLSKTRNFNNVNIMNNNNCNNSSSKEMSKEEGLLHSNNSTSEAMPTKQKCRKLNVHFCIDLLLNGKVKVVGVLSIIVVLFSSIYAAFKLQDGFELTDLIPRNTSEYNFIDAQSKLFGFYNIFAVTQGNFEYPQNQKLLREYHESFIRIPNIIKNDNGGLPDFWLNQFRNWLVALQNAFDRDYANSAISKERWYNNASVDGILAFKLLAQTGHVDNPIDKSLITHNRLVDAQGIINPKAFYNYLSAWAWNDAAYAASQSNLRPSPRTWIHSPKDKHMEIPKSAPLTYTQLPFYLHGLYTTKDIKLVIQQIRDLCNKFSMRGLPNYPTGIPFLYWAQYFNLDLIILISLGISTLVTFFLSLIFLQSAPASILVVMNALFVFLQLFGVMLILNVKLSAIAAIVLISSMGLSICFTANLSLVSRKVSNNSQQSYKAFHLFPQGFLTSIGNRERRLRLSIEHNYTYILHGISTSVLILLILFFSPFEFIVKHFFCLQISFWILCAINSLFHFPLLLLLFGTSPELVPRFHANRISTPSPQLKSINKQKAISLHSNKRSCRKKPHHCHVKNNNLNNEPSLTTITEEPSWQSSASSNSNISYRDGNISDSSIRENTKHFTFPKVHQHHINNNINSNAYPKEASKNSPTSSSSSSSSSSPNEIMIDGNQATFKSIIVQPEVTVETSQNGSHQNTKVTATANIKLEFTTGSSNGITSQTNLAS